MLVLGPMLPFAMLLPMKASLLPRRRVEDLRQRVLRPHAPRPGPLPRDRRLVLKSNQLLTRPSVPMMSWMTVVVMKVQLAPRCRCPRGELSPLARFLRIPFYLQLRADLITA